MTFLLHCIWAMVWRSGILGIFAYMVIAAHESDRRPHDDPAVQLERDRRHLKTSVVAGLFVGVIWALIRIGEISHYAWDAAARW